jgi:hypothetical protein
LIVFGLKEWRFGLAVERFGRQKIEVELDGQMKTRRLRDGLVKPRKSKVDWRKGNSHGTVNAKSRSNGLFPIRFTNHLHLPSPASWISPKIEPPENSNLGH